MDAWDELRELVGNASAAERLRDEVKRHEAAGTSASLALLLEISRGKVAEARAARGRKMRHWYVDELYGN